MDQESYAEPLSHPGAQAGRPSTCGPARVQQVPPPTISGRRCLRGCAGPRPPPPSRPLRRYRRRDQIDLGRLAPSASVDTCAPRAPVLCSVPGKALRGSVSISSSDGTPRVFKTTGPSRRIGPHVFRHTTTAVFSRPFGIWHRVSAPVSLPFGPFTGPSDLPGTTKLKDIRGADGNRSRARCETRGDSRRLGSAKWTTYSPSQLNSYRRAA